MDQNQAKKQTQKYNSLTLNSFNQHRQDFLPCFPTSFSSSLTTNNQREKQQQPALLLSSVPNQLLSGTQLQCRQPGVYPRAFEYKILGKNPSFLNLIYQSLYQHLSERLHVDEAILDFNLTRLDEAMFMMARSNDQQYWTEEQQKTKEERDMSFDVAQLAIALEIFLQTDVDMLYMKTCSYRGAQPRSIHGYNTEGIFCVDPPEARYGFLPCTRDRCRCCLEPRHLTGRPESAVSFYSSHYYKFLNGYQVILNCPATCTTANIIYALTCPCHQFEYIGETKMAFCDRLWRHRQHGLRIMHEFIIGKTNINHTLTEAKSAQTLVKDGMRLYRHSTLCGTAMQMFLECNPQYWCCVPMNEIDAKNDDRAYAQMATTENLLNNGYLDDDDSTEDRSSTIPLLMRTDEQTQWYVDNLPLPPHGYRFSYRQRNEQHVFFKNKQDLTKPSVHLDLYNATIVFVLPENCSDFVRRFVESLLITHTESNLNTAGQLATPAVADINHRPRHNPLAHGLWCENLIHPHRFFL